MSDTRDNRELGKPLDAHVFDEAALADYLAENIPGFERDCTIQQFLGGQSNPTYLVESGTKAYVLRKKPPGKLLPSAHAVDREYQVISPLSRSTTGSARKLPQARSRVRLSMMRASC